MLSDTPPGNQQATSSSTPHSQISDTTTIEQFDNLPPGNDSTLVGEDDIVRLPSAALHPQASETAQVVPAQISTPLPLVNRPTDAGSGIPMSPGAFESPQFVTPQELPAPPQFVNSAEDFSFVSVPALHTSPSVTPLVFEDFPTTHEHPFVAPSPVLGSSQAVTLHQISEPHSLVTPSLLESSQAVTHQAAITPTVADPLSLIPCHVLGSSQPVTFHQVVPTTTVTEPLAAPAPSIESPQIVSPQRANASQNLAPQHQITGLPPQAIQDPQPAIVYSSDLAEGIVGSNLRVAAMSTSAYKLQSKATATPPIRRDSIEGVPDVVLTLSPSGYQLQDPLATPAESILTTPSTTPSPEELVVPSSQQSLEEYLTIPMEITMSTPTMPSVDDPNTPPSQQSLEEHLTISAGLRADTVPDCFRFAPRVIPNLHIDRSDFPSWLLERGRLDFVLSVEAGDIWKKLITTWLRQERRAGFGLNEKLVS